MVFLTSNYNYKCHTKIVLLFENTNLQKKLRLHKIKYPKSLLKDFQGKENQILTFYSNENLIILIGLGEKKNYSIEKLTNIFKNQKKFLSNLDLERRMYILEDNKDNENFLEDQIIKIFDSNYKFDKYLSKKTKKKVSSNKISLTKKNKYNQDLIILTNHKKIKHIPLLCDSIKLVKDLGNEPSNILNPDSYVELIKKRGKQSNFKVKVFNNQKLNKMGLLSLLSVSAGSKWGGYLVEISLKNTKKNTANICLIGKGITFDSGGISLKPSKNMEEMKNDMLGSATVLGAIDYLAKIKCDKNVYGYLAIAENMPGKDATRPGDVVKSYSGKTIEIINTDAEGRLVMADALTYCQRHNNPDIILDLATLTGQQESVSCHLFTNVMSCNKELVKKLVESGEKVNEKVVELPLYHQFIENTKSKIADIKNSDFGCGSSIIHGGAFLANFIENDTPWAHLDIAGPSYINKESTGMGVRLLADFILNYKK